MQKVINLTQGETVANSNRVRSAQSLIEQLPPWHDGRNSWLLKYGVGELHENSRAQSDLPWSDFYQCSTAQPSPPRLWEKPPIATCAQCGGLLCEMSSRGRCVFCEEKRANSADAGASNLRAELAALKHEYKSACATVVAHDDELAAANEQIAALCEQLSNAQADIAFYQENAADALTAKDQVEALREALDVANQEIKRLESSPKIMQGQLVFKADAADLIAINAHLLAELDSYKKRYTSAKVMPGSMPDGLTIGEALLGLGVGVSLTSYQAKDLHNAIEALKKEIDHLHSLVKQNADKRREAEDEAAAIAAEKDELQVELDDHKMRARAKQAADIAQFIITFNVNRYGVNDDQKKG